MADLDNSSDDGALTAGGMQIPVVSATWTSATTSNTALTIPIIGCGTIAFEFVGTGTLSGGAITFEVSPDNGTTWYSVNLVQWVNGTGNPFEVLMLSGLGGISYIFTGTGAGFTNFRARLSTVISGTGSVFIQTQGFAFPSVPTTVVSQNNANKLLVQLSDGSNNSILTPSGQLNVALPAANLCVSATAATGVAVTATLPAVAGQFHYISSLIITKIFTATNAASATPLLVTTTNLPGSLTFSFGQPLGTIGTDYIRTNDWAFALKSSVVNTATTIVCPATTGIIWRVNVFYYAAA
jgi:hypothetical protein